MRLVSDDVVVGLVMMVALNGWMYGFWMLTILANLPCSSSEAYPLNTVSLSTVG
jgi:hypothetical protein